MDKITGNISPIKIINGNISSNKKVTGNITYGNGMGESVPIYDGNYEITPLAFQRTVLETEGKKMASNVVCKEIPYYETSNLSGGTTVYIAGKIEFE